MVLTLRDILSDRAFQIGLALRILLIAAWGWAGIAGYGAGWGMTPSQTDWLLLAAFGQSAVSIGGTLVIRLLLLIADGAALMLLLRLSRHERQRSLLCAYWLSPAGLFVNYCMISLALVPLLLLMAAFAAVLNRRTPSAAPRLGLAALLQPVLAMMLPFWAIYALGRPQLRGGVPASNMLVVVLLATVGLLGIFLLPPAAMSGVLASMTGLSIPLSNGSQLFSMPLALIALIYIAWRSRPLDFDMLWTFCGLTAMALLLLDPRQAAWAVLALPFLALHTLHSGPSGKVLFWLLAVVLVPLTAVGGSGGAFGWADGPGYAFLYTMTLGLGTALALQMARRGVLGSPFFRAMRRPFAIGIAGDSGTGKDTLAEVIVDMLGPRACAHVSGDDYHIWDRQKPMWRALTHLDPKANDLDTFNANVTALVDRRPVRARHYDHVTGRMTKPTEINPAETVLASGLHALWSAELVRLYDVRLFLAMDEPLRRFLKIRRDVGLRGHAREKVIASIERRRTDGESFIHPQAAAADVVITLEPRQPDALADEHIAIDGPVPPLRLRISAGRDQSFGEFARILTALCGMQVTEAPSADGRTQMLVEGDPTVDDIAAAAIRLAPAMREIIAPDPRWHAGPRGIMQLVVLQQLDRVRHRRSLTA